MLNDFVIFALVISMKAFANAAGFKFKSDWFYFCRCDFYEKY